MLLVTRSWIDQDRPRARVAGVYLPRRTRVGLRTERVGLRMERVGLRTDRAGLRTDRAGLRTGSGLREEFVVRSGPGARLARPARPNPGEEAARAGFRSYLLYLAIAFVLAVALSWSYSTTARLGYRIENLKREIASLQRDQEKLRYELAGLQSMARIEQEATRRLGMVRPSYVRVVPTATDAETDAVGSAPDSGWSTARIIQLTPAGSARAQAAEMAGIPADERGLVRSLWDRLYQWLTGVSQAEARGWH